MSIPGLLGGSAMLTAVVPAGTAGFDLAAFFGSPPDPIVYQLHIPSTVTAGAPTWVFPNFCVDASGLHVDSVGWWFIQGKCLGAGGDGGDGGEIGLPYGGGGGGAGAIVGAGGLGTANGTDGAPGQEQVGGLPGVNSGTYIGPPQVPSVGNQGGDAVYLSHTITVFGSGQIGGGGGGGGGGTLLHPAPGGGGAIGLPPPVWSVGTAAGYAIRYVNASASADVTGFTGSIDGNVGL